MAFNINAQVILSGPKNLRSITKNIKRQLSGLTATVNVKIPSGTGRSINSLNKHISTLNANLSTLRKRSASTASALSSLNNNLKNVTKNTRNLATAQKNVGSSLSGVNKQLAAGTAGLQSFGKEAANAIRRFAAFSVATGVIYGFVRSVQDATKNALEFQRELVKLQQITGQGGKALDGVRKTVDQLSKSLGIDANQLLKVGKTFAQTGQSLDQVRKSMEAVAKASLAPTFGTMESTTEGLIAALAQFNIQAKDSEKVLGALNAVSKKFAVESSDLIASIRKAGGVFAATANQMTAPIDSLNELISIFTAVRSTTRESADTIATGLRTIFTRIQRPRTIEFLKQFGIELVDLRGNFKGIFPAFKELSKGLQGIIAQGDTLTLARITEELGGIRQVGKLIPAIKNFDKALRALDVASKGAAEGLGKDVALALQPLAKQFEQLQARFSSFVRSIADSKTFQSLAKVALTTANAFLSMAEALKPLLPLITALAATKITSGLVQFGQGFAGGFKKGGGARGLGSAVGGIGGGGTGGAASSVATAQTNAMKALSTAINSNNQRLGQNTQGLARTATALGTLSTRIARLGAQLAGLPRVIASSGFGFGSRPRAKAAGGKIQKFASGGHVRGPSHGAGGVLAELEGGEYVVPKYLANGGGLTTKEILARARAQGGAGLTARAKKKRALISSKESTKRKKDLDSKKKKYPGGVFSTLPGRIAGFYLNPEKGSDLRSRLGTDIPFETKQGSAVLAAGSTIGGFLPHRQDLKRNASVSRTVDRASKRGLIAGVQNASPAINKALDIVPQLDFNEQGVRNAAASLAKDKNAVRSVGGFIFEGIIQGVTGAKLAGEKASFDFPNVAASKEKLANLFTTSTSSLASLEKADAKRSKTSDATRSIFKKVIQDIKKTPSDLRGVRRLAAGGNVFAPRGTDTVPAMLTPGEFVINKSSAQKIGYSNLGKMNRYAKGGAVGHTQYLQLGGLAERPGAIQGASALFGLATTFATLDFSSENASESLRTLAIASSFLLPQLSGLGDVFKGLTKKGSFLQRTFTREGRATSSRIESTRLSRITRLESVGTLSDPAREARRQTALTKLRDAKPSKFAKIGKGGLAATIATLLADPVIDFIGSKTFGQQGGRAGRDVQRAEAEGRVLGGAKGLISGAATGAFIGSFAGPVGTLVGGIIGGVGGLIEGALRGAKLEGLRQSEFDSIQKLQKANEAVAQTFRELAKAGHSLTTAQLSQGTEVLRQRRQDAAGVERASLRRREEEDKGFGGLGIGARLSATGEFLTGGMVGRSFQQQAEDRQSASVQAAVSTVTQEEVATATEIATRATEKLVNGIGNLSPEMLTAIATTGDMTAALANSSPAVQRFGRELDKMQKEALAASVMAEVGKQLQILNDAGDRKGAVKLGEQYKSLTPLLNNNSVSVAQLETAASKLDGPIKKIVAQQAEQRKEAAKSAAITKQLAIAQADAAKRLDAFVSAFDMFGRTVSQVMDKMNNSIKIAEESISALSQVSTEIGAISGTSVFKNLETASTADIQGAVADISSFAPDAAPGAFKDVVDVVRAQKELPDILRGVVEKVADDAAKNTFDTKGGTPEQQSSKVAAAIEKGIAARGIKLPDDVLKNIQTGLQESFSRQGAGGVDIGQVLRTAGLDKIQGIVGEFGTVARKAMQEAEEAVQKWRNGLIKASNLQLKLTRQQIASQLKINQKQFSIQDKIDKVLGKAPQFQAKGRVQTQLQAILGPGGGVNVGGPGRADQLLNQRQQLEQQRKVLETQKQTGVVDRMLVDKLRGNAEALERNKKATELLANDVSVLSDLERRAAQAAQREQAAIGGVLGFSEALDNLVQSRGPGGGFSREGVEGFNQFTEPIRALFKASRGEMLGTRQARSLIQAIQSGDSRIATLLDNLPGGKEQADALKRNVARGLAQSMRRTLMNIGGPAASLAQVPGMLENAIFKSMGEKQTVAQEIKAVGDEQNKLLAGTMDQITQSTLASIGELNTKLDGTLQELTKAIQQLDKRRGGAQGANSGDSRLPVGTQPVRGYASGGFVRGPSHGAGGVMANLEGGEFVVPKGYANGGLARRLAEFRINKNKMSRFERESKRAVGNTDINYHSFRLETDPDASVEKDEAAKKSGGFTKSGDRKALPGARVQVDAKGVVSDRKPIGKSRMGMMGGMTSPVFQKLSAKEKFEQKRKQIDKLFENRRRAGTMDQPVPGTPKGMTGTTYADTYRAQMNAAQRELNKGLGAERKAKTGGDLSMGRIQSAATERPPDRGTTPAKPAPAKSSASAASTAAATKLANATTQEEQDAAWKELHAARGTTPAQPATAKPKVPTKPAATAASTTSGGLGPGEPDRPLHEGSSTVTGHASSDETIDEIVARQKREREQAAATGQPTWTVGNEGQYTDTIADVPSTKKPKSKSKTPKPAAKPTGPKTPSLRHQRAFMRRQARKRRLGIATDFDTSRGSGAFRPGVQGRLKESGLWNWAGLGRGAGGAPAFGTPQWNAQAAGATGATEERPPGPGAGGAQPTGAPATTRTRTRPKRKRTQKQQDFKRFRELEKQQKAGNSLSPTDQAFFDQYKSGRDSKIEALDEKRAYRQFQNSIADHNKASIAAGVDPLPTGFGLNAWDVVSQQQQSEKESKKVRRTPLPETIRRAGPATGGTRVRRRGERSKPQTAAQLDREESLAIAESYAAQARAHTEESKELHERYEGGIERRAKARQSPEVKALTAELLAKKGRDPQGRLLSELVPVQEQPPGPGDPVKLRQQTVSEIRQDKIAEIQKNISKWEGVQDKQKQRGQKTGTAQRKLQKLQEELSALQKISVQDKAHAAHLQGVSARQERVVRKPSNLAPEQRRQRDKELFYRGSGNIPQVSGKRKTRTQQEANERFLQIQTEGLPTGYREPKRNIMDEEAAAQHRGDYSMFMEDKPKLGKESDVFGFGDSEREKRMRARVQAEGDWRVGHRESMGLLRKEKKDRQTARFRRARGYAGGGAVFMAAGGVSRGTDTVPAMLTPGEYVINRGSAQKIGYSNLNSMNRLAQGGQVRHYQYGSPGGVQEGDGSSVGVSPEALSAMQDLSTALKEMKTVPEEITMNLEGRVMGTLAADVTTDVKQEIDKRFKAGIDAMTNADGSPRAEL